MAEGAAAVNEIAATAGTTEDKKGSGEVGTEHAIKYPAVLRKAGFSPQINLVLKDNTHTGKCTEQSVQFDGFCTKAHSTHHRHLDQDTEHCQAPLMPLASHYPSPDP